MGYQQDQKLIQKLMQKINGLYKKIISFKALRNLQNFSVIYEIIKQLLSSKDFHLQQKSLAKIIVRMSLLNSQQDRGKQNKKLLENCLKQIYLMDDNFMRFTQGYLSSALKMVLGKDATKYLQKNKLNKKNLSSNKFYYLEEIFQDAQKNERLLREQLSSSAYLCSSSFNQSLAFPLLPHPLSTHSLPEQKSTNGQFLQINLAQDQQAIRDEIKRKIIGILNSGGGYLVLGKRNNPKANRGSEECLNFWSKKVEDSIKDSIFPKSYKIQVQHEMKQKFIREDNTLLLKIQPQSHLLYFLIKSKTANNYEPVFLSSLGSKKEDTFVLAKCSETYSVMLKIYEQSLKARKKSEFCIWKSMEEKITQNNQVRRSIIQQISLTSDADESLILPYKFQSMFIVGSQDTKQYKNFISNLCSNKINCVVRSPFMKYRNNSKKLIAIVSHENNFENVFSLAKKSAGKQLKAFISVYPNLLIPLISEQIFKNFQNIFEQKYGEKLSAFRYRSDDQMRVILWFRNCQQSIFSFCFMQNQGIRCQFIKKSKSEALLKDRLIYNDSKAHYLEVQSLQIGCTKKY